MIFKKITSKSISLALIGVIVIISILNTTYAMENNSNTLQNEGLLSSNSLSIWYKENFYENIKKKFKSKFGNSDEFKLIVNTKYYRTEVNGHTGQLRITTYDINGNIENIDTIDYLKNIKELELENIKELELKNTEEKKDENSFRANSFRSESYVVKTIKTGGIDPFSLSVKTGGSYKSKYKMYATSYYNRSKTWYKNYWKDGYTKGLYDEIIRGRNAINNIASSLSPGVTKLEVLAAFSRYISPLTAVPTLNIIAGILGLFTLAQPVMTIAGYTLTYLKAVNIAQYNFNKI